ncbi:hypothetical protein [Chitinophaga sp. Cy-1792]|uniref:hypothetical protein n=1 Tax=Chitinophaga sp. Cy-1792 TaxID=2608339 RepID=UPI00141E30D4|nr:hypothetical protein [Chitinophaga sp. Cy-1792]NIG56713.1 hypothetical protein [Chitinophaga sp. Cy-1792]
MEIEKRFLTYLVACCATCSITTARAQQATALRPYVIQAEVTGTATLGSNSWSVAGNSEGANPNVLSELKWKQQAGIGAGMNVMAYPLRHWLLYVSYLRTGTVSGTATDNDYAGDNRTRITYSGHFAANHGYMDEVYTGIGYTFLLKKLVLTATGGYTATAQLNYLLPADAATPADLSSTYKNTWKGVAVGVFANISLEKKLQLIPGIAYYQQRYYAAGNWNLISAFSHPLSFAHNANGYGIRFQLQGRYACNHMFGVLAGATWHYAATGHGAETLYLKEGGTAGTRMNAAYTEALNLRAGIYVSCGK